jgi:hypothetical protein
LNSPSLVPMASPSSQPVTSQVFRPPPQVSRRPTMRVSITTWNVNMTEPPQGEQMVMGECVLFWGV